MVGELEGASVAVKTKRAGAQTVGDVFSAVGRAPRHKMPDDEMDPEVAYQIVHDELMLDGNARLNLATFVGTWMEPQAQRLMAETFDKNMINKDEYPQTAEMEMRCIDMISRLWHAPDPDEAPGVGWIIWRKEAYLPEDLIFKVNYLGDVMPTFALNFSRPGAQVVAQYYNFIRLGFEGYRRVHQYCRDVAQDLAREIEKLGPFELVTRGEDLPVFAFKVKDSVTQFNVFDVSNALRERGWQVPAYTFPDNRKDLAVLRVVVKRGFTHDVAGMFINDLKRQLPRLERQTAPVGDAEGGSSFKH
jgi:glutamate/tyrosine decarboxylase-like PLP-dependent enzyme